MPGVRADFPGVEAPDDDVEATLRVCPSDGGDVGETDAGLGEGVDRDVTAVARQHDHDARGTGLRDGWGDGVQAGGVGGGEGQRAEGLRIAETAGGDAAEVGEHMFAARR